MSNIPKHLYKYRDCSERSLDIIGHEKIWFPKPTSFNDPYDCQLNLSDESFSDDYVKYLLDTANPSQKVAIQALMNKQPHLLERRSKDTYEHFRSKLRDEFENAGVLSLCARVDSLLLWSHYANNHGGICIELDCDQRDGKSQLQEIVYSPDYPNIKFIDLTKDIKTLFQFLTIKSEEWAYEHEWRFLETKGDKLYDLPAKISSVILGARINDEDRERVIATCNGKQHICVKKARLSTTRFQITVEEL